MNSLTLVKLGSLRCVYTQVRYFGRIPYFGRKFRIKKSESVPVTLTDKGHMSARENFPPDFVKLGMNGRLIRAVYEMGFREATAIQRAVIPVARSGNNIIASAATGTGKTAAFGISLFERIHLMLIREKNSNSERFPHQPLAIVMVPTRELAEQISSDLELLLQYMPDVNVRVLAGGRSANKQLKYVKSAVTASEFSTTVSPDAALRIPLPNSVVARDRGVAAADAEFVRPPWLKEGEKVDVVVATPAKTIDYVGSGMLDVRQLRVVVLDEMDKMLDMGFLPDVVGVYRAIPTHRLTRKANHPYAVQTMMLSATVDRKLEDTAKQFGLRFQTIQLNAKQAVAPTVKHIAYTVTSRRKFALLIYLLKRRYLRRRQVLVFTRTKQRAQRLCEALSESKFAAASIHKDVSPSARAQIMADFCEKRTQIVVATDLMARGVDIPDLPFVVNYDVPVFPKDYIHRVGRTGRAGQPGTAITFVGLQPQVVKVGHQVTEINERHFMGSIESLMGQAIKYKNIPGRWNDRAEEPALAERDAPRDDVMERLQRLQEHEEEVHQRRVLRNEMMGREPPKARPIDPNAGLRQFRGGRYEDVVKSFESHSAEKRGIRPNKPVFQLRSPRGTDTDRNMRRLRRKAGSHN